jgi:hypothetical protein
MMCRDIDLLLFFFLILLRVNYTATAVEFKEINRGRTSLQLTGDQLISHLDLALIAGQRGLHAQGRFVLEMAATLLSHWAKLMKGESDESSKIKLFAT